MRDLVAGIIGIALLATFLGFLVWWLKALPFTVIVVVVVLMLIYDFVRTLRYGDESVRR